MATAQHRQMSIDDIVDSVQVVNRVQDAPVKITFDGRTVTWQPSETKSLPRKMAEWFQHKSLYKFQPGNTLYDEPARFHYKLGIVGVTDCEPLTFAEVNRMEILDRDNMPPKLDRETRQPLRTVYIDPRGTGVSTADLDSKEREVKRAISGAIVRDAAEKIAEAAEQASPAEIDAAVSGMVGTPQGA